MHKHHLEENAFKRQDLQGQYLQDNQHSCLFQNVNKDFFSDKSFEMQLAWKQGGFLSYGELIKARNNYVIAKQWYGSF